jgi:hypothetical protein
VSNADLNNDGIADAIQTNVNSLTNNVSHKQAVLETDEGCTIGTAIVKAEATNTEQDFDYDYPEGLFNFTVSCAEDDGYTATIKQYYYGVRASNLVLRKYNSRTNTYFTINDATISSTYIGGEPVTVATYQVQDGGALDMDGQANGVIVDPAGLAVETPRSSGNLGTTGQTILQFTKIAGSLLVLSMVVMALLIKRPFRYRMK